MDRQEKPGRKLDDRLADLFEQAHRDPALKRELLRDPRAVADRFDVVFEDDEIQQLQKLGALSEFADEVRHGRLFPPSPIFYPIDIWRIRDVLDIFTTLIPGDTIIDLGPIFYPAPEFGRMGGRFASSRAYNPDWVSYPGPEGGGGTGGIPGGGRLPGGGGVVPGPIFYPAGLRSLLKERLLQVLQIRQRFLRG